MSNNIIDELSMIMIHFPGEKDPRGDYNYYVIDGVLKDDFWKFYKANKAVLYKFGYKVKKEDGEWFLLEHRRGGIMG